MRTTGDQNKDGALPGASRGCGRNNKTAEKQESRMAKNHSTAQKTQHSEQATSRTTISLNRPIMNEVEQIRAATGTPTKTEVIEAAIALLKTCVFERSSGRLVMTFSPDSCDRRILVLPILERVPSTFGIEPARAGEAAPDDKEKFANPKAQRMVHLAVPAGFVGQSL
ncbi:MAG TPA: ribbon-helix-helix protein, CopG family [Verrucomicrobiae bacterium]|jgi:hypothetical protein